MPWIDTQDLRPAAGSTLYQGGLLSQLDNLQVYCGLDCCLTLEIREELDKTFGQPPAIYAFERALQAPYLEIMQRGFRVDLGARAHAVTGLRQRLARLNITLGRMAESVWGKSLNARSSDQLQDFFYSTMRIPEIWISIKGQRKLSMNREVLEKLEEYLYARPIIAAILAIRDISKQIEVLETEVDSDGRFRTSYNIAGTETGRPSSSTNAFGTGGNAQNIAPALRYVFVADQGKKLCVIDLEQVEARDVGWLCGVLFDDWSYLLACESGDLHTNNARRIWRELPWTGEPSADRLLADRQFYRDFSYRDMAKRGSHLSNYMGTAWTASRALKVPIELMEDFQARYIKGAPERQVRVGKGFGAVRPAIEPAFPCIPRWWQWVAEQMQTTHQLVTPWGRRRHFFGRPEDDTTLREAIAYLPQSMTADRMNLGMWRVWKKMGQIELLAQTYDSITFQYDETADESKIIQTALELIQVELLAKGRSYVVPGEAKVGFNWGATVLGNPRSRLGARQNPEGLLKWSPAKPDTRKRRVGMDRVIL